MYSFRAFECDHVGDVAYLKADYNVICGQSGGSLASNHAVVQSWATVAIVLYSLGIPFTYACLLYQVRKTMANRTRSALTIALGFLHEPFQPQFFWWELVLVLQKLILVGLFVLQPFKPGSFLQLLLGISVAFVFTVVQMQMQPYRSRNDNLLASISGISVCIFFFGAVLYRVHELTSDFDTVSAQLTSDWASRRFIISFGVITAVIFIAFFGTLFMMMIVIALEFFAPQQAVLFRWQLDHSQVVPPTLEADQFHTFLSHNWASGQVRVLDTKCLQAACDQCASGMWQDQAKAIKSQLSNLVLGLKIWLGELYTWSLFAPSTH